MAFAFRHDAAAYIKGALQSGAIKDCAHLYLKDDEDRFNPACAQSSLKWRYDDKAKQAVFWCPEDCLFFKAKSEANEEAKVAQEGQRQVERRAKLWNGLKAPFRYALAFLAWYGKAPWQTQVVLIFAAILLLAPKYVPWIVELIKAIRGN